MTVFGLDTEEKPPDSWTPLEAVVILKCLDEDGKLAFMVTSTESISDWEAYALLELSAERQKVEIMDAWEGHEES